MPVNFLHLLWEGMTEESRQNIVNNWNHSLGEPYDYILKWQQTSLHCKGTCGVILCKDCIGDLENVLDF